MAPHQKQIDSDLDRRGIDLRQEQTQFAAMLLIPLAACRTWRIV